MSTDAELFDGEEVSEEVTETTEVTEAPTGEKDTTEEVEAKTEESEPEESSPDPESSVIPITALHGERDRRKAAEARAKELEAKLSESEKPDPTSVFEDENKFRQEILTKVEQDRLADRLEMSEKYARLHHGDETVDKALDWFVPAAKESPLLQQKFNEAGNDIGKVVELFQGHEKIAKLDDPNAFEELKAKAKAEALAEIEAEKAKKANLANSIPESLTDESSTGNLSSKTVKRLSDEELFDS